MIYWTIFVLLIIAILVSGYFGLRAILKQKLEIRRMNERPRKRNNRRPETDDKVIKEEPRKKREKAEEEKPVRQSKRQKGPRRWKIVLENISTGEMSDFIFVNSVGIGRTTQEVSFEQFLSIPYDKRISKVHCSIVMLEDGLYIKDEGSKNHTYLNGKKITKPVLLQKEDMISVGDTDLEVVKIFREAAH